jgi:L-threonylcarbamoyladenylate synthase
MNKEIKLLGQEMKDEKIAVIPTDTIYGIVCSAFNKKSVERLYEVRKRNLKKPMVVLISSVKDLDLFGVKIDKKITNKYWPGKVSIIVPVKKFKHLHRGKKSLAFRLPKNKKLIEFLKISGPLVAPSANIEGKKPARTIEEAKKYFTDKIDFYLDEGRLNGKPSKIISLEKSEVEVVRK